MFRKLSLLLVYIMVGVFTVYCWILSPILAIFYGIAVTKLVIVASMIFAVMLLTTIFLRIAAFFIGE